MQKNVLIHNPSIQAYSYNLSFKENRIDDMAPWCRVPRFIGFLLLIDSAALPVPAFVCFFFIAYS